MINKKETVFDVSHMNKKDTIRLNEIAELYKTRYTEFVDYYSRRNGKNPIWWTTPFASRNIYLDETFINICLFVICKEIIGERKEIRCIIVSNRALQKCLQKYVKKNSRRISVICEKDNIYLRKELIRFWKCVKSFWANFKVLRKHTEARIRYSKETVSLIATPTLSSCFSRGKYHDRYFNRIQEYMDRNILFIPTLMDNNAMGMENFAKSVAKSINYKFLIKESFLTWGDYFKLLFYIPYCLRQALSRYYFEGEDISPLVRCSFVAGLSCKSSLEGILDYEFVRRLKKANVRVDNFIAWYEGRPNDIMITKAFRTFYPEVNCVGYEGFALSESWLSLYVSEEQYQQKSAPAKIAVGGSIYVKSANQFCKELNVISAPILRTSFRKQNKLSVLEQKGKNILLVLPFFWDISARVIKLINEFAKTHPDDGYHVFVKNHPVHRRKKIQDYYKGKIYFDAFYVDGELLDCLSDADIVVTAVSTSSMEILCQGRELIVVCEYGKFAVTFIPQEVPVSAYHVAYDAWDFSVAVEKCLKKDKSLEEDEIEKGFEQPSPETVARLWG